MKRLCNATLADLPETVTPPAYARAGVIPGIVHLGIGAFHRAHQAAMTETVLASGARDWGVIAASLRSPDTRDALTPQDGLYTLAINAPEGVRYQVIGAILRVIVAPEAPEVLLEALCLPSIRIVSLTITEKGYCLAPATGTLDENHPDIRHDLANPQAPRSAIGFLAAALARRRAAGFAPFTVLCCDNLPANGLTLRRVVTRFATLLEPDLGRFVAQDVAFPCTMVDRIVPATTNEDRARVALALGLEDAWPVMAEPFSQWVIEDHFPQGRPAWEQAGAQIVADVAPHELMKLRMLNGSHSMLAYLGGLAGHAHVSEAAADPVFERLLALFWQEVAQTLPGGAGLDPAAYARALRQRYANPRLRHRLAQIAMDGSGKIPQRWLAGLHALRAAQRPAPATELALAGFLVYMGGTRPDGSRTEISDPLAQHFTKALQTADETPENRVRAALGLGAVFGDLGQDEALVARLAAHVACLGREGVARAAAPLFHPPA